MSWSFSLCIKALRAFRTSMRLACRTLRGIFLNLPRMKWEEYFLHGSLQRRSMFLGWNHFLLFLITSCNAPGFSFVPSSLMWKVKRYLLIWCFAALSEIRCSLSTSAFNYLSIASSHSWNRQSFSNTRSSRLSWAVIGDVGNRAFFKRLLWDSILNVIQHLHRCIWCSLRFQ